MKRKTIELMLILIVCIVGLTGCDPKYPLGKLKVNNIKPISQGTSIDIEIIYPNTGGTVVLGWKNQNVEIISGNDIVSISGLTVTGIKSGTARIKINATTDIADEAVSTGMAERIYSTEIDVEVE